MVFGLVVEQTEDIGGFFVTMAIFIATEQQGTREVRGLLARSCSCWLPTGQFIQDVLRLR